MTHLADHSIDGPFRFRPAARGRSDAVRTPRLRCRDRRWPAVMAALAALRATKRCSVRIIDADCGAGSLLLNAVRYTRTLGFTSVEAHGVDETPVLIARAQAAAADVHDPAVGIFFETAQIVTALSDEAEFPADIVLWHGHGPAGTAAPTVVARAVACAGDIVIADPVDERKIAARRTGISPGAASGWR